MNSTKFITQSMAAVFLLMVIMFSGCAHINVAAPTFEETQAARAFKKTVAFIECRDTGSQIHGVNVIAQPAIESLFMGRTNLVERKSLDQVFNEWQLQRFEGGEKAKELGRLLGADYLVSSNVTASTSTPELKHYSKRDKEGKFYGGINEEALVEAEVVLRIIDVATGEIVYSGKKQYSQVCPFDLESFDDEVRFKQALEHRSRTFRSNYYGKSGGFVNLPKSVSGEVSRVVTSAVSQFSPQVMSIFIQSGEILEVISDRQVIVNLGSAYGIVPGNRLVVWEETTSAIDPKTGVPIVQRKKQAILTVKQVTSGLSCVAQGSPRDVRILRVGDKVYTY